MYSCCMHDQQDLCWGNTSRDASEEPQEPQEYYYMAYPKSGTQDPRPIHGTRDPPSETLCLGSRTRGLYMGPETWNSSPGTNHLGPETLHVGPY